MRSCAAASSAASRAIWAASSDFLALAFLLGGLQLGGDPGGFALAGPLLAGLGDLGPGPGFGDHVRIVHRRPSLELGQQGGLRVLRVLATVVEIPVVECAHLTFLGWYVSRFAGTSGDAGHVLRLRSRRRPLASKPHRSIGVTDGPTRALSSRASARVGPCLKNGEPLTRGPVLINRGNPRTSPSRRQIERSLSKFRRPMLKSRWPPAARGMRHTRA